MERGANAPHYCEALRLNARALCKRPGFSAAGNLPAIGFAFDHGRLALSHFR